MAEIAYNYTLKGLTPTDVSLGKKMSNWLVGSSFFWTTKVNWSRLKTTHLVIHSLNFSVYYRWISKIVNVNNLLNIARGSKCTFERVQIHVEFRLGDQITLLKLSNWVSVLINVVSRSLLYLEPFDELYGKLSIIW